MPSVFQKFALSRVIATAFEASFTASFGNNPEYAQAVLRVSSDSLVSPAS